MNERFHKSNFVKYLGAFKWKFVNKKCNAKIYINENLTQIVKTDNNHQNHLKEQSPLNLKIKSFSNQLKGPHHHHVFGQKLLIIIPTV